MKPILPGWLQDTFLMNVSIRDFVMGMSIPSSLIFQEMSGKCEESLHTTENFYPATPWSKLPPSVPCRSDTLKHQATPASSQGCSMVTKSLRGLICIRRSPAISFSLPELSTAWGSTQPLWAQMSWAPPVMAELVVKILPVPKHFLSASVTVYT